MLFDDDAPLCPAFNALVLEIARDAMPQGWDAIPDAPATLADLVAYWRAHGRIAVNSNNRFGLAVGEPQAYWAFRAWHDLLHVHHDTGEAWTMAGERAMAELHHEELIRRLGDTRQADYYADLIRVEIDAANGFYVRTCEWPEQPRQFAIGWLLGRGWKPSEIEAYAKEPAHSALALDSVGG